MTISDSTYLITQFLNFFTPMFGFCGVLYLAVLSIRRILHV